MKLQQKLQQLKKALRTCGYIVFTSGIFISLIQIPTATAELNIEVSDGIDTKVPIAVFPFVGEQNSERNFSRIIISNLTRSGLFALLPASGAAPQQGSSISGRVYEEWAARGVEKVVLGRYVPQGDAKSELRFELIDVVQRKRVLAYAIAVSPRKPWQAAHLASDYIYKELTGTPGMFTARLAYITSERIRGKKRRFGLHISDADGQNAQEIFSTPFQIMSPTWSPDAKRLAYVSFETGTPEMIIQNLTTAERQSYAKYMGAAISPAWSPDGRYIAYSNPGGSNYDIYILDMQTLKPRRITKSAAVDVEPSWSPDGALYFTSDRAGRPQLYRLDSSGVAKPVTNAGEYEMDSDVSPDGKHIAYLSQQGGSYSIKVRNLQTTKETTLGSGVVEENPNFTPNGQLISHITMYQGRTVVGLYTIDGSHRNILPIADDNLRAIAWSPLQKPQ